MEVEKDSKEQAGAESPPQEEKNEVHTLLLGSSSLTQKSRTR
jgi:hypothetical protein